MARVRRDAAVAKDFKASRAEAREDCCAVCRWRPPRVLRDIVGHAMLGILHGHHVVPMACGGVDDQSNMLLACPNHHAIAHRIGTMARVEGAEFLDWTGPSTPAELLCAIEMLSHPDEFKTLAFLGYRVSAYLEAAYTDALEMDATETIRLTRAFTVTRGTASTFSKSRDHTRDRQARHRCPPLSIAVRASLWTAVSVDRLHRRKNCAS